ncbi:nucleotide sugar dehydrogenase [Selenomonas sp. AE3005]|uniref:nucleotide sugar dehydrogenase n=1 Tax=Selenomonas sp. AE3005 TaxID=1485543 RepID=UPI0025E85F8A|nr:nucleotide sugar dehydrogenase [Selenomonas sp. AE3005]
MSLFGDLCIKKTKVAVVGLGYVGLPLAAAFAEKFAVIGFDRNERKIAAYEEGRDVTAEIGNEALQAAGIDFTTNPERLSEASFIVIAVPTPINGDKTPDLDPVKGATEVVAKHIRKGSIVVYESTVYPGVTENICRPLLEEISGLQAGRDFKIGYSPERINPGDKVHRLKSITKIVSGEDAETLKEIADIYGVIIDKIYKASSIKVAEAAKLVENTQRDINIAFMNELAMVFHQMGIDTADVAAAMDTKWNALKFRPGLVGGHCIGVDPYYFIYEAENLDQHSQMIAAGRRINNDMSKFVANEIIKVMLRAGIDAPHAKIYLLGMTFKENCPDTRNSRSVDIYHHLQEYGLNPVATDPVADKEEFKREYGIELVDENTISNADCLVLLVAHDQYVNYGLRALQKFYHNDKDKPLILIDVKSIFERENAEKAGYIYWCL